MNSRIKNAQAKIVPLWDAEIGRGFRLQVSAEVNDEELLVVIATPSHTTYGYGILTETGFHQYDQYESSVAASLVGKEELSVVLEELKKWAVARDVMTA